MTHVVLPDVRSQGRDRRRRLLNGQLALGDVESAEALARGVLDDRLRASGAYLNPTEYEDALSYLIGECWGLYQRYDPAKGTQTFSTFAYRILWRRVASWYRQRFVDTRYHENPSWVTLDDNDVEEGAVEDETTPLPKAPFTYEAVARRYPHLSESDVARLTARANHLREEAVELQFDVVELKDVSPEARRVIHLVALPMFDDELSLEEVAERFGFSRRWVTRAVARLRVEIGPALEPQRERKELVA